MSVILKRHLIVCPECQGKGKTLERTSGYDSDYVNCGYCQGQRVVEEQIIHNVVK